MRKLIGHKKRFSPGSPLNQVMQHLASVPQFAPADPERNQQPCGGVYRCPDPRAAILTFGVFLASITFFFFTKV